MPERKDHRQQSAREHLPKNDSPNGAPLGDRATDERVGFRYALGQHVVGKESVKNLQQHVELELRPDAGKHERSHRGHTELLICVRLRNKNAKGKAA